MEIWVLVQELMQVTIEGVSTVGLVIELKDRAEKQQRKKKERPPVVVFIILFVEATQKVIVFYYFIYGSNSETWN